MIFFCKIWAEHATSDGHYITFVCKAKNKKTANILFKDFFYEKCYDELGWDWNTNEQWSININNNEILPIR